MAPVRPFSPLALFAITSLIGCAPRRLDPALVGAWFPADGTSGFVISAKGYGYLIAKRDFLDRQTNSNMSFTVRNGNLAITPLDEEGGGEGGPAYTSPYHLRGDDLELDHLPTLDAGPVKFPATEQHLKGFGLSALKFRRYRP